MDSYQKMIDGHSAFLTDYTAKASDAYRQAASLGQDPKVLVIGCADSRVDPALVVRAQLGELFVVRTAANLVLPCKGSHDFAVGFVLHHILDMLALEHIIVMGHSGCAGMGELMARNYNLMSPPTQEQLDQHINTLNQRCVGTDDAPTRRRALEQQNILLCLQNLQTYPTVARAVSERRVSLHAWYFQIEDGQLYTGDPESGKFSPLPAS